MEEEKKDMNLENITKSVEFRRDASVDTQEALIEYGREG